MSSYCINNDYIKRFCKRTKENIERKKAVLYINAFLYLLKGDIFKSVEIYDDISAFNEVSIFGLVYSFNTHVSDFVRCSTYNAKVFYGPGVGEVLCRISILNLYSLFSYFGYRNGMDYILDEILIEIDHNYSFSKKFNEIMTPIRQIIEGIGNSLSYKSNFLISPKDYSIKKYGSVYGYEITIPKSNEWWKIRGVISKYYGDEKTESIKEDLHKLDLIFRDKINETESKIRSSNIISLESINYLKEVLHLNELVKKGNSLFDRRRYKSAIKYYDEVIESTPKAAIAWYNKGAALYNLRKYEEAIECYDKVVEINPKYTKAWFSKKQALIDLTRYKETIECLDKMAELNIEDVGDISQQYAELYYLEGNKLISENKYKEAIEYFDKGNNMDPKDAKAWYSKGVAFYNLGKSAQKHSSFFKRNNVFFKHKELKKAIFCFDKTIDINPKYADAWYIKACAYSSLKNKESTLNALKQAIKLGKEFKQEAKENKDFDWLWDDNDFKRVVS